MPIEVNRLYQSEPDHQSARNFIVKALFSGIECDPQKTEAERNSRNQVAEISND